MKAFLTVKSALVAVLLLSACATQIQKSLENETGEIWKCQEEAFLDEFFAVYDETSGTGYVLYQSIGYKSNFQKVQQKPKKIFAERVTTGLGEDREWHLPNGKFRIWDDGSAPEFFGKLTGSIIDIDMRCMKDEIN